MTTTTVQLTAQPDAPSPTQIDRALRATQAIVDAVRDDQWTNPTPCPAWDAHALTNHVVGGLQLFATALAGGDGRGDDDADWLGADPQDAYRQAAPRARDAWHEAGALDRTVQISLGRIPAAMAAVIHLTEITVHGIDLAVATGLEALVDQDLCLDLLGLMQGMGGIDAFRAPGVFGAEVPASPGLAPHRQLLAYTGRSF